MAHAASFFDTHKFVRKLKESGFNDKQAEALTEAVQESQAAADVATKGDISDLRHEMQTLELRLTGEMKLLKWILGFIAAGVASLVLKAFF